MDGASAVHAANVCSCPQVAQPLQAEIATAEATQRLIGVSSAPARTFIEAARRAGYVYSVSAKQTSFVVEERNSAKPCFTVCSVPPGTSPTVLSILQQKTTFDHVSTDASVPAKSTGSMLGRNADVDQLVDRLSRSSLVVGSLPAGNAFAKQLIPAGGAVPSHASTSGLAAALRSGNKPPVSGQSGGVGVALAGSSAYTGLHHSQDPEPLVGSVGRRRATAGVVLATSFREHMPAPLPVATEDEGEDDDSEDEGLRQARRRVEGRNAAAGTSNVPAGQTYAEDDDDDEAEAAALNRRRAGSDSRDDGVFESDL